MKFLKITAAILSLALLTACKSGQSVQTSETVSETETVTVTTAAETKTETTTSATTTTATETATEQSADDISEADKELLKILTDETGLPEEVLLEYARKMDDFEDIQRRYSAEGIYDFNGDGVPEIYVGGWDMDTPYTAVYDISGDAPEFMFSMTTTTIDSTTLFDGIIYLCYDRKENQYFYYTMTYWQSDDGLEDKMYFIDKSRIDADLENHILGEELHSQEDFSDEDEWKAACEEAEKELCNYVLIDTLRTLKEPYLYDVEGNYGLRLLYSYFRNNSRRRLAMLLNETGISGLTFHMTPDEVKELLGEPKEFIDDTEDFNAVTLKYDSGSLTFVDLAKDGNYRLAFMRLYSFDFCGITENTSRSELISALKDMGIYPEPNFNLFPEIKTLENTDQITAGGDYNGLGISFDMDGDRIEYLTASFVALT